jgi:hypothetical protein
MVTKVNSTVIDATNSNVSLANNASFLGGIPAASYAQTANLPAGGFSNMQVFTSSGTFTVPTGITKVKVTVVGGGGGSSAYYSGSGAGAAIEIISNLTPGANVTVTVGAGGAIGSTGGTSSFGAFCSATGGSPQNPGGIGSGGQLNFRGQGSGGNGHVTGSPERSAGGNSIFGGGGGMNNPAGGPYGGGAASGADNNGSAGGAGVVVVEW